jgi:NADH-quinone oxidoreductase subunit J
MLVVNLLSVAGLYLALQSSFLSIIQVIVYAGAIVVLFLFVIMLLGVQRDDELIDRTRWHAAGGVLGGIALAGLLAAGFVGTYTTDASRCGAQGELTAEDIRNGRVGCAGLDHLAGGSAADPAAQPTDGATAPPADDATSPAEFLGERLFTRYTFVFEAAGLLLVVATLGALVLGRRADTPPDEDPAYEPAWEPPPLDDFDELDAGDLDELDADDADEDSADVAVSEEVS